MAVFRFVNFLAAEKFHSIGSAKYFPWQAVFRKFSQSSAWPLFIARDGWLFRQLALNNFQVGIGDWVILEIHSLGLHEPFLCLLVIFQLDKMPAHMGQGVITVRIQLNGLAEERLGSVVFPNPIQAHPLTQKAQGIVTIQGPTSLIPFHGRSRQTLVVVLPLPALRAKDLPDRVGRFKIHWLDGEGVLQGSDPLVLVLPKAFRLL